MSSSEKLDQDQEFCGPFRREGSYQGLPVVLVPLEEFQRLASIAGRISDYPIGERTGTARPLRLSKLDQDPELAEFIQGCLGRIPQSAIHAEAVQRFGPARAPSKSALSRFAVRWAVEFANRRPQKA